MSQEPEDDPGTKRCIGPYRLLEELGEGGMGVVYRAFRSEPLRQEVALKLIRSDRASPRLRARFEMELQAIQRMDHPNIAKVFDTGFTDEGQPYIVMELVRGVPIDGYCAERRLSMRDRLLLFQQVCDAVQHVHQKGIIHRDLKPTNVLVAEVDDRPVVKLIDFGLARATDIQAFRATLFEELRRVIGTIAYMSPEQAGLTETDIDTRTDVYSLGVILYELLTDSLPYDPDLLVAAGPVAMQQILRQEEPKKPSTQLSEMGEAIGDVAEHRRMAPRALLREVSGDLDWIVLRALAKAPKDRYPTARDLGRDLQRHLRHEPVEATAPGVVYRLRKWARRHRAALIAGGGLAAGLGFAAWREAESQSLLFAAQREALLDSDAAQLAELERQAEVELWPQREQMVPAMESWLQRAAELAARLALHRQRQSAGHLLETDFCKRLATFAFEPQGAVATVRARAEWSRTIKARTVDDLADAWDRIAKDVKGDPRYAGFDLRPQPGLVPIGKNEQGCWEFALLDSGAVLAGKPGTDYRSDPEAAIVLVMVPGGPCVIGCAKSGGLREDPYAEHNEGPARPVELDPFLISKYEMTTAQWKRLTGTDPSNSEEALEPVEQVSWVECDSKLRRWNMMMPTEAQWERACRAGSEAAFGFGADPLSIAAFGNTADRSVGKKIWPDVDERIDDGQQWPARIGSYSPNGIGLFDMHGNVAELCRDAWTDDLHESNCRFEAGTGRIVQVHEDRSRGVHRGGSFRHNWLKARCSARFQIYATNKEMYVGVRPAMAIFSG